MNKKSLIFIAVAVVVLFFAAVASVWYIDRKNEKNVRGDYLFAETKANMEKLQTINLSSPDGMLTIYRNEGVWHFKEAGDYYVNAQMLGQFFNMVNKSIIMTVQDESAEALAQTSLTCNDTCSQEGNGLRVQIYDEDGKLMDDVIIGRQTENEAYRFAKRFRGNYIYSISEVNGFTGNIAAWVPFPLLQIPAGMVDALSLDSKYLDSEVLNALVPYSRVLQEIMDSLAYLTYDGIVKKADFSEQYPKAEPHTLKVQMLSGLVYVLDVYSEDGIYWLAIRLDNVKIPQKDVIAFVKQNQKYYADWLFMLGNKQGKLFYDTRLR